MDKYYLASPGGVIRVATYNAFAVLLFIFSVIRGGTGILLLINILSMGLICSIVPVVSILTRRRWAGRLRFTADGLDFRCVLCKDIFIPWNFIKQFGWARNPFRLFHTRQLFASTSAKKDKLDYLRQNRVQDGFIYFDYNKNMLEYAHANIPVELMRMFENALSKIDKRPDNKTGPAS